MSLLEKTVCLCVNCGFEEPHTWLVVKFYNTLRKQGIPCYKCDAWSMFPKVIDASG